MQQNKLPADPSALVLGIVALVIIFLGCCCGLFAFVALGLSITGLILANKSLRLFRENAEVYSLHSGVNVKNARIVNIIALVLSSLISFFYFIYLVFYGAMFSSLFFGLYDHWDELEEYDWQQEAIYKEYEPEQIEIKEKDTLAIDSLKRISQNYKEE